MELRMLRVLMGESAVDTVINAADYITICSAWANRKNSPDTFVPLEIKGYAKDGLLIPMSLDAWLITGFVLMGVQKIEVSDVEKPYIDNPHTHGVEAHVAAVMSTEAEKVQAPQRKVK